MDGRITAVRAFNRRYTALIGVLQEGLLDTPYSLTEARVLFELRQADGSTEVLALRRRLDLDPGYLSRLLSRFEADGLVVRERSAADGRRQLTGLTARGQEVSRMLDRRSDEQIGALLDSLPPTRRDRLVAAMTAIQDVLDGGEPMVALRDAEPGDHGWVISRNAARYAAEYGWDGSYEALVARIVADYLDTRDPARERAWIAEVDGERAGCVYCVREDDTTARLRLLLVEPGVRGLGVGTALVRACLRFAAEAGYRSMVLWTNDVLSSARRIYQREGFTLVESAPHHSFGHDLVGQTWRLDLEPRPLRRAAGDRSR